MTIPLILTEKFFKIIPDDDDDPLEASKQLRAACQICPSKTVIKGSKDSTGNFYCHMRRKHPEALKLLEKLKVDAAETGKCCKKRPHGHGSSLNEQKDETVSAHPVKKAFTPFDRMGHSQRQLSQNTVNELVFEYIADEMKPICTVEKPSFKKLINGYTGGLNPPCRKTTLNKLHERQEIIMHNLKHELNKTDYVCTTADIWSASHKSYNGVTFHFIDANLKRQSGVLACKRIKFSHTYREIGTFLSDIHKSFNLTGSKLVGTVTDNASNFAKSFRVYKVPESVSSSFDNIDFLDENVTDIAEIPNFDMLQMEDAEDGENSDVDDIFLLPHFRCCSHTLNLVATTDAAEALKNASYKEIYNSTFSKLTALWNTSHRSTKSADMIEDICKTKLPTPCATRWNSLYDCIDKVLTIKIFLPLIFGKLQIPKLKPSEVEYLEEYKIVMEPLAKAIDILQGEDYCFFGYILQTIMQLDKNLKNLTHLVHCDALRQALLQSLNKRFGHVLGVTGAAAKQYILATVSIPKFKLKWMSTEDTNYNIIKTLFISEMEKTYKMMKSDLIEESPPALDKNDFFYTILSTPTRTRDNIDGNVHHEENRSGTEKESTSCTMQFLQYLQDKSSELKSLHKDKYNIILEIFKLYNTVLPSSGAVGRLFSAGGQILTPRRNRLSDDHFEMLLMLTKNKHFHYSQSHNN